MKGTLSLCVPTVIELPCIKYVTMLTDGLEEVVKGTVLSTFAF